MPEHSAEVRPGALPKVPAGHGLQTAAPAAAEKVPRGHCAQVALEVAPVAALAVPGGQGTAATPPGGQYDPRGQAHEYTKAPHLAALTHGSPPNAALVTGSAQPLRPRHAALATASEALEAQAPCRKPAAQEPVGVP